MLDSADSFQIIDVETPILQCGEQGVSVCLYKSQVHSDSER